MSTTVRKPASTRFHGGAVKAGEVDRRAIAVRALPPIAELR